jgi:hypothetical protein
MPVIRRPALGTGSCLGAVEEVGDAEVFVCPIPHVSQVRYGRYVRYGAGFIGFFR